MSRASAALRWPLGDNAGCGADRAETIDAVARRIENALNPELHPYRQPPTRP